MHRGHPRPSRPVPQQGGAGRQQDHDDLLLGLEIAHARPGSLNDNQSIGRQTYEKPVAHRWEYPFSRCSRRAPAFAETPRIHQDRRAQRRFRSLFRQCRRGLGHGGENGGRRLHAEASGLQGRDHLGRSSEQGGRRRRDRAPMDRSGRGRCGCRRAEFGRRARRERSRARQPRPP